MHISALSINVATILHNDPVAFAQAFGPLNYKHQHTNTGGNLLNPLIAQHRYFL